MNQPCVASHASEMPEAATGTVPRRRGDGETNSYDESSLRVQHDNITELTVLLYLSSRVFVDANISGWSIEMIIPMEKFRHRGGASRIDVSTFGRSNNYNLPALMMAFSHIPKTRRLRNFK